MIIAVHVAEVGELDADTVKSVVVTVIAGSGGDAPGVVSLKISALAVLITLFLLSSSSSLFLLLFVCLLACFFLKMRKR